MTHESIRQHIKEHYKNHFPYFLKENNIKICDTSDIVLKETLILYLREMIVISMKYMTFIKCKIGFTFTYVLSITYVIIYRV